MYQTSFQGQLPTKRRGIPLCKKRLKRIEEFKRKNMKNPLGSHRWKEELIHFLHLHDGDEEVDMSDVERWIKNRPSILEHLENGDNSPTTAFYANSGPLTQSDSGQSNQYPESASGEPEVYENFTSGPIIGNVYSTAGSNHAGEQQQATSDSGPQFCQTPGLTKNQQEVPAGGSFEDAQDLLNTFNAIVQINKKFPELKLQDYGMRGICNRLLVFQKQVLQADIPSNVKIEVVDLEDNVNEENILS